MLKDLQITKNEAGVITAVTMVFDGPEGKGEVTLSPGSYGPYVSVNGRELALIDLFYLSDVAQEEPVPDQPAVPFPQIVIYDADAEDNAPVAYVRWLGDFTETKITVEAPDTVTMYEDGQFWHTVSIKAPSDAAG